MKVFIDYKYLYLPYMMNCNGEGQLHYFFFSTYFSEHQIKLWERKLKISIKKLFFHSVQNWLVHAHVTWYCRDQKRK